jgi:hypothetical protein
MTEGNKPLPGTAVFAGLVLGAAVGAAIAVFTFVVGAELPANMAGLTIIVGMVGAGAGGLAGLILGAIVWKLDHFLFPQLPFMARSAIECALITAVTGFTTALTFWGQPLGTIAARVSFGSLFALAVSAAYFAWRYRKQTRQPGLSFRTTGLGT